MEKVGINACSKKAEFFTNYKGGVLSVLYRTAVLS